MTVLSPSASLQAGQRPWTRLFSHGSSCDGEGAIAQDVEAQDGHAGAEQRQTAAGECVSRGAAPAQHPASQSVGGGKEEERLRIPLPPKDVSSKSLVSLVRRADRIWASFKRPQSWVLIFGWSLAMCAGTVNVVAFRSWNLYVSHMTGDTTAIGMRIEGVHQRGLHFYHLQEAVVLLLAFVIGAFSCGLLIDKNQVHFGGKSMYGLALIGNSILFIVAASEPNRLVAACLATCACGLQNAMCTSHLGAVVRTTHVTGTVTDIGSTLGRIAMIFLRHGCRRSRLNLVELADIHVDERKLMVLLPMWVSYLLGGIVGAYLYTLVQVGAMLLPASLTMFVGVSYCLFRQRLKQALKEVDQKRRLNKDMISLRDRMKDRMERMEVYLRALQQARTSCPDAVEEDPEKREANVVIELEDVVVGLEEGLEDMLETMRDLKENIESFCQASPRSSTTSSQRRSSTSSPGHLGSLPAPSVVGF